MAPWAFLIKRTENGWRGTVPDLPDVVVEGSTPFHVEQEMARAIEAHLDGIRRSQRIGPRDRTQLHYADVRMTKARREERDRWPKPTPEDIAACRDAIDTLRHCHVPLPGDLVNELLRFAFQFDDIYGPDPRKPIPPPHEPSTRSSYDGCEMKLEAETLDVIGPEGRGKRLVMKLTDASGEHPPLILDVGPKPDPEAED